MIDLGFLPHVNASLNAAAGVLLVVGVQLVRRGRIEAHRNCLLGAALLSCLFLVSYVTHYIWRASVEGGSHTLFHGEGLIKTGYYLMLFSHILLAMFVPFIAAALITLGLKRMDAKHKRLARIGYPIWLYVSVTGVLIYLMLYWFNPAPPA